jgi:hypothetical protein
MVRQLIDPLPVVGERELPKLDMPFQVALQIFLSFLTRSRESIGVVLRPAAAADDEVDLGVARQHRPGSMAL